MATTTGNLPIDLTERRPIRAHGIPWYIWCGVLAVTSGSIGGSWDVSWHRSIGRDTFWTPAHIAIYACGVLAAVVCGYLIAKTSFGNDPGMRASSVAIFGLRAPFGAFIAAWGGVAMLTSAPFDNWWHAAYGLDVRIVSPPHTLLILGMRAVAVGVLFLLLAEMNRAAQTAALQQADIASRALYRQLQWLFLYLGGLAITGQMFFLMEYTWDVQLHSAQAYIAMALALPIVFATISSACLYRWSATAMAAVYMLFGMAEILILPLFPAQPKLGPVFNQISHMVPGKFPVLLIVPALALDLLWRFSRAEKNANKPWSKPWVIALASGVVFVVVLVVVEWPFANFLMSKWSENRFFGTIYFDYNSRPHGFDRERVFLMPSHGFALYAGLARAIFFAFLGSWVGLRFGRWMRGIQR